MEIRNSKQADIPMLKHIWQSCFHDTEEYITNFFETLYNPELTVVADVNGTPVGVVYILKATLSTRDFYYGYAIGVLPEYRGNSICQKMLAYIKKNVVTNNQIFGLHPANDKLSIFYQSIGLSKMYSLNYVDASNFSGKITPVLIDIAPEEYLDIRKKSFHNLVEWDIPTIRYIFHDTLSFQGVVKKVIINNTERILLGRCTGDTLYVKETTMNDLEITQITSYLKQYFSVKKVQYTLPPTSSLKGNRKTTILGFGNESNDVYMNLFLD